MASFRSRLYGYVHARTKTPVVQFAQLMYSGSRTSSTVTVSVRRIGSYTGPISVNYTTTDSTAIAGVDYLPASGTLTWDDGDATDKTFPIVVLDRSSLIGDLMLTVSLNSPVGAVIGIQGSVLVNLVDQYLLIDGFPNRLQIDSAGHFLRI